MVMKKSSKKPIVVANHPATIYLNTMFHDFKLLLDDKTDVYEKLHQVHLEGKEKRTPLSYITVDELRNFARANRSNFQNINVKVFDDLTYDFNAVLGWKQFKQIYKFTPELLEELWSVDFEDERFVTISRDEVDFLPCHNFFVEQTFEFLGHKYCGFFVFFDKIPFYETSKTKTYSDESIHILFITEPFKTKMSAGDVITDFQIFNINLSYGEENIGLTDEEGKRVTEVTVDGKEILKFFNPNAVRDMGEELFFDVVGKASQMINYLACSNADMLLTKKPKRKPDIKRTTITDLEHTEYRIGDSFTKLSNGTVINQRYINDEDGAYVKGEVTESDSPTEREVGPHRTGYHMRPHMRKAHWHFFWYGKKDGTEERVRRRKYVSAVFINKTGEEIEIPTREIVKLRF